MRDRQYINLRRKERALYWAYAAAYPVFEGVLLLIWMAVLRAGGAAPNVAAILLIVAPPLVAILVSLQPLLFFLVRCLGELRSLNEKLATGDETAKVTSTVRNKMQQ